jgi:hypothetical protein
VLACEEFLDRKAFQQSWSTEIHGGAVELTRGTPGNPGYWLAKGQVGDGDQLSLVGTVISASAAYRGREGTAKFDGQFGTNGYASSGGFGKRRCTLNMARASG